MRYNLKMKIIKEYGTQAKFAKLIGMRPQRLSAIIQGDRPSSIEKKRIDYTLGGGKKLFYNKE
jgi:plasmid maintenance system antidote protein VapI